MIFMVKTAFENNVECHELTWSGKGSDKRIIFISDTHARKINEQMLRSLKTPIDAVIIGGDFVDRRTADVIVCENLSLLTSLGPTYFIWGNNDREKGEDYLRQLFTQYGVHVVENNALLLTDGPEKIWISAVDDTSPKIELAFQQVEAADKVIFVSHNPAIFQKVRKRYTVDLMLGGHLHGGQIRIGPFGLHPHGFFKNIEGCTTLISNGYGTTLLPFRLFARPQCHIIHIYYK